MMPDTYPIQELNPDRRVSADVWKWPATEFLLSTHSFDRRAEKCPFYNRTFSIGDTGFYRHSRIPIDELREAIKPGSFILFYCGPHSLLVSQVSEVNLDLDPGQAPLEPYVQIEDGRTSSSVVEYQHIIGYTDSSGLFVQRYPMFPTQGYWDHPNRGSEKEYSRFLDAAKMYLGTKSLYLSDLVLNAVKTSYTILSDAYRVTAGLIMYRVLDLHHHMTRHPSVTYLPVGSLKYGIEPQNK